MEYHVIQYEENDMADLESAIEGDMTLNGYTVISVALSVYNGKCYALVAYSHPASEVTE